MSLLVVGESDQMAFKGLFQLKQFCDKGKTFSIMRLGTGSWSVWNLLKDIFSSLSAGDNLKPQDWM